MVIHEFQGDPETTLTTKVSVVDGILINIGAPNAPSTTLMFEKSFIRGVGWGFDILRNKSYFQSSNTKGQVTINFIHCRLLRYQWENYEVVTAQL